MARADTWLSLEQIEYRADVLRLASSYVSMTADAADKAEKHSVTSAACWCANIVLRQTAEVFRQAVETASASGGAPIAPAALDVFRSFHAVEAIRKEVRTAQADRRRYEAARAAHAAAQAQAGDDTHKGKRRAKRGAAA